MSLYHSVIICAPSTELFTVRKKEGEATLTATYKDLTASILVHVYKEGTYPTDFTVPETITIGEGYAYELKATHISNKEKGKLFRSLNQCYKFGVVIRENNVLDRTFQSKKDKQRYLDYAYKIAVKRAFQNYIQKGFINPDEVERIYFYVDEHTTATNGRYELAEALEQEFKLGTYNYKYDTYYPPIFRQMKDVQLEYCNSESKLLVRAADIVANRIYYLARQEMREEIRNLQNMHVIYLP